MLENLCAWSFRNEHEKYLEFTSWKMNKLQQSHHYPPKIPLENSNFQRKSKKCLKWVNHSSGGLQPLILETGFIKGLRILLFGGSLGSLIDGNS